MTGLRNSDTFNHDNLACGGGQVSWLGLKAQLLADTLREMAVRLLGTRSTVSNCTVNALSSKLLPTPAMSDHASPCIQRHVRECVSPGS